MKIEVLQLSDLRDAEHNSRTHSADQIDQIAASIKEFGFTNPVLVDSDNGIIAGHGRVMAAQKLGMTELPCIEASHLTKSMIRNGVKDCLCEDCGTEFTVRKDTRPSVCKRCVSVRGGKSTHGRHRTPRAECKSCGSTFRASLGYTYCSIECRAQDLKIERDCKNCGDKFHVLKSSISGKTNASGNFCGRKCYENYLCRTERTSGRGSQWSKIRLEVIKSFPHCAVCGTTKNLQVHHITPFRLTRDNSKQNLVPLCLKHHRWIETMFVETERFGVTQETELVWRNMIRSKQTVTASIINEVIRATT